MMIRQRWNEVKPLLSVLIVVSTLFSIVFIKMEDRRMGYTVLRATHEYKKMSDHYRLQSIELARVMRPERIRSFARSKLTLDEAKMGQIIHMSGDQIAFEQ